MTYQERLLELKTEAESLGMNLDYVPEVKGVFPEQNDEWLRSRKEGIGGSEAGTVLGINHYSSVVELALDKLSVSVEKKVSPESQYTLDYGHALEPLMLKLYEAKTGFKTWQGNNTQYRHPLFPFMYGDCDGYAETSEGEKIGIECKTFNYEMKHLWKSGVYGKGGVIKNPEYAAQVAHYMAVENLTRFDLIAICGNNPDDLIIVTFFRDLKFEKNLIEKEAEFWSWIERGEVPPSTSISDSSFDRIIQIIGADQIKPETKMDLPQNYLDAVKELNEISEKRSQLNKQLDSLKQAQNALLEPIIEEMKGNEKAEIVEGDYVYTISFKPNIKSGVDAEKLEVAYPDIFEEVKKENITKPIFRISKKLQKTKKK